MSVTANIIVNIRVESQQVFSVCYLKKKKVMIPADEKSKSPTTLTLIYVDRYSLFRVCWTTVNYRSYKKHVTRFYLFICFFFSPNDLRIKLREGVNREHVQ